MNGFTLQWNRYARLYLAMLSRLIAIVLILATIFQVPALAYAAVQQSSHAASAKSHACSGQVLSHSYDCDSCCTQGVMPSCSAHCGVLLTAAVPLSLPVSVSIGILGILLPDSGLVRFSDHAPPNPFRPPIV